MIKSFMLYMHKVSVSPAVRANTNTNKPLSMNVQARLSIIGHSFAYRLNKKLSMLFIN